MPRSILFLGWLAEAPLPETRRLMLPTASSSASTRLAVALSDRYRIVRQLGEGGMATVFLAEDLKHDRQVALKVLKPELAAVLGAERFVVEIKTTASLQHPHILPLFDSGEADGFLFYVMPFIEGETLRSRLDRETQLDVAEAVRLTCEIGDALHYAHQRGVIHRDIKPENILLHDGRPIVADFGIALAVSAAAGGRMTETGLSLGTPHYMSPEQATADKQLTARSDIYSLGSMLYEMLAGEPPHTGTSAQQIIMRIIAEGARPVTEIRKSVPSHVAAAVAKSLEKLPADRFATAKEFIEALKDERFTHGVVSSAQSPAVAATHKRNARIALAASVIAVVASSLAAYAWTRPETVELPLRLDLSTGAVTAGAISSPLISPDGQSIAIAGERDGVRGIYLRSLTGDGGFRFVSGTEGGFMPVFSPDGKWIAFSTWPTRAVMKVLVTGGNAVALVNEKDAAIPEAWSDDDQLWFTMRDSSFRVSSNGGEPALAGADILLQQGLPGGALLYSRLTGDGLETRLGGVSNDSSVLLPGGRTARFVAPDILLYVSTEGELFAVRVDVPALKLIGTPVRVLDRIGAVGVANYSVSSTGTLAYQRGLSARGINTRFVIINEVGATDTLPLPLGADRSNVKFSPDGSAIAYRVGARDATPSRLEVFDLRTGRLTQLTDSASSSGLWSPRGDRLLSAYPTTRSTRIVAREVSDSARPVHLMTVPGSHIISGWLAGDTLISVSGSPSGIFVLTVPDSLRPVPYLQAPWAQIQPRVSPDHKYAVHLALESGMNVLFLREFPVPVGKWKVTESGSEARWSPDNRTLYYWGRSSGPLRPLFKVAISRNPVSIGTPQPVGSFAVGNIPLFDLHPDGKRFIVGVPEGVSANTTNTATNHVIVNFVQEVQRLLTANERAGKVSGTR